MVGCQSHGRNEDSLAKHVRGSAKLSNEMKLWEELGIGGIGFALHRLVVCIAEDALRWRSTSHSYRVLPRRIEKIGGLQLLLSG